MDSARAAVAKFTQRKGHTTEVDEIVQPGITSEVIKPHRHEETTQAIDREVHQHHHHTTVQPIQHQEVLPERHQSNVLPVREQEFVHGDPTEHKQRLAAHLAQFKDTQTVHQTQHSTSAAPVVAGEHVHHHVHEIVQPVLHKETIQPEVIHTVAPVHEVHHHHATHHGMSALPMKSLNEFKQAGGILTGSKSSTHETYEGEPRPYNSALETTMDKLGLGHSSGGTSGMGRTRSGSSSSSSSSDDGHGGRIRRSKKYGPDRTRTGRHRGTRTGGTGFGTSNTGTGSGYGNTGSGYGQDSSRTGYGTDGTRTQTSTNTSGPHTSSYNPGSSGRDSGIGSPDSPTSTKKPSLMDRLNPMKDTDRDGKKGVME